MFKAARRFLLTQRIEELEKSINRYPDSPKLVDRQIEYRNKVQELKELEGQE